MGGDPDSSGMSLTMAIDEDQVDGSRDRLVGLQDRRYFAETEKTRNIGEWSFDPCCGALHQFQAGKRDDSNSSD
jgi:hypothetical protein